MDEQHYEYRTGRTDPVKSCQGMLALILICAIFLGGLVSALGIMNIHLLRELKKTAQAPLSFAEGKIAQALEDSLSLVGMALQETDPVYQQLHALPQGLYVSWVEPGSLAEKLRIQPGDVLISLDEMPVFNLETVKELLNAQKNHILLLWRDGREISLRFSH